MAEFFYTKGGERSGPVNRASLQDLIDRGDVSPSDFYWVAGMDEWKAIGDGSLPHGAAEIQASTAAIAEPDNTSSLPSVENEAPASTPVAAAIPQETNPQAVSAPTPMQSTFGSSSITSRAQGDQVSVKDIALKMPKPLWLVIPALFFILTGILYGISIIGLIVAWLPIWLGVLLFQANKALESARVTGYRNDLMTAVEKLELYFRINGILFILGFILMVVYFVVIFAFGAELLGEFGNL